MAKNEQRDSLEKEREKMDDKTAENQALTLFQRIFFDDLEKKIREIDRVVLGVRKHTDPMVLRLSQCSSAHASEGRIDIGDSVSYIPIVTFTVRLIGQESIARIRSRAVDTYVIWTQPIICWLEMILEGKLLSMGRGHAAIKERWFLLSLALVRARTISHKEWFPELRMRTKESLVKHRDLFAKQGDDLAGPRATLREFRISDEKLKHDPVRLDIYVTLQLIVAALEHDIELKRALTLLYSDEY